MQSCIALHDPACSSVLASSLMHACLFAQEVVHAIEQAHRLQPQLVTRELVDGARGLAVQAGALPGAPPPPSGACIDHDHFIGELLGGGGAAWGLGGDGGDGSVHGGGGSFSSALAPSSQAAAAAAAPGAIKCSRSISMVARRNAALSGIVSNLLKRPMGRCDI